jgi:hypothetical protein
MSDKPNTDEHYEEARDLAEAALEQYAKGHPKVGDKLAGEAVQIDRHAVEDLVEEMGDEPAATSGAHDPGDAVPPGVAPKAD